MTVNFSPFRSTHGFSSPGFDVSTTGDVSVVGNISSDSIITNNIQVDSLILNGISLFETEDSTFSLSSSITNSSLTSLGKLVSLEVSGDVDIVDNFLNKNISIVNGIVSIKSTSVGFIDNIDIGTITPRNANFNTVSIGQSSTPGQLSIIGTLISNNATITLLNSTTSNLTTINADTINSNTINVTKIVTDDVTINNTPTELFHATRKDYVDNRITALSIALGA